MTEIHPLAKDKIRQAWNYGLHHPVDLRSPAAAAAQLWRGRVMALLQVAMETSPDDLPFERIVEALSPEAIRAAAANTATPPAIAHMARELLRASGSEPEDRSRFWSFLLAFVNGLFAECEGLAPLTQGETHAAIS